MLFGLTAAEALLKLKAFFLNKYTLIALAVIVSVAGGVLLYKHEIKSHVAVAVQKDDDHATIASQSATIATTQAGAQIDSKYDQKAATTQQEYARVRTIIVNAPTAPNAADPLIVSTIDALAGLHGSADADGVSNSPD